MLETMMSKLIKPDLRTTPRFKLQNPIRLNGSTLPLVVKAMGSSRPVEGHVQNISSGGLCLLAQKPLKISELLVGEIAVPGTQASIPTLLQVRWLHKSSSGPRYRAGLHYVLQSEIAQALQTSSEIARLATPGKAVKRKVRKKKS